MATSVALPIAWVLILLKGSSPSLKFTRTSQHDFAFSTIEVTQSLHMKFQVSLFHFGELFGCHKKHNLPFLVNQFQ